MTASRLLAMPGDTAIGAVTLTSASIRKLVELYEERQADPDHPAPYTVVILCTPEDVPPMTLRDSAVAPGEAFPKDRYLGLAEVINAGPHLFDDIDSIVPTPGSSAGNPRFIGLSIEALMASTRTIELALEGPGRWILAMSVHYVVSVMILLCVAVTETSPQTADTSEGSDPRTFLSVIQGAMQDGMPSYLSFVPTQLAQCLGAGEEIVGPMRSLASILVGGAATNQQLLARIIEVGLRVCLIYGMTETTGGRVYGGKPLPGTSVHVVDRDGRMRLTIHDSILMTRYPDAESPSFDEGGRRWLLTGDLGIIRASGTVEMHGHTDDVIASGGLSIVPGPVRPATHSLEGVSSTWIMGTPDEKWGHVVAALVVIDQMPSDSLEMAELGSAIREHTVAYIRHVQAPRRIVAVESLPYLDFDKIDCVTAAQATAEASDTEREWVH